jgi:hypothetical protein
MPVVKAGPNEYLLVGRKGTIENRGSAIQAFLWPGTIFVLVPSTKQEATFEFTQETKDGIPLRFKGIVIYRITDPAAAARLFAFDGEDGVGQITTLLTHICLGELRHAVSHMTMAECIEQRKTTLTGVVETAMRQTVHGTDGQANAWGIDVEVAQVAQVFIVDSQVRQQLEAEVRNEIKVKSDQSDIRSKEEIRLTEMASEGRVQDRKLATDKDALRRDQERLAAQLDAERDRLSTETPVRLLKIEKDHAVAREELELRRLQNEVRELAVAGDLMLERGKQGLRREMLPLEQAPQIVESASKVLQGTNLSIYGEHSELVGQLAPVFELLGRAVQQATGAGAQPSTVGDR